MIARYSRPEMSSLWTEQARFNYLLRVELAVLEVLIEKKKVPLSRAQFERIKKRARFDVERIKEIEKHTNHDLIAFLKNLEENIGPSAKYIHKGLTSSDVLDTALALQLRDGIEILEKDLVEYLKALKKQARKYKNLPLIGRTHGIHAEPITLGLKLLSFYSEGLRNLERLRKAREEVAYIKISGAVGSYSQLPPDVEKAVAKKLKLKIEPVSTQVIPRDRIAYLISVLALVTAGLERLALEIRHLQRTEVSEVFEPFGKKQKGSSAMPHKRNPILCERICGLARMFRGYLIPAIENISLWHERDISHSSVERIILPDGFILLDYMLNLMTKIVEGLEVNKQAIEENLWLKKGLFASQRLMLMLIDKGLTRSQAYDLVQKPALKAYKEKLDFKELVLKDRRIKKYLCDKEINSAFDLNSYLKHIDSIFNRFF
ncbi:MAG TPA: adenylosuccinate lyase [Candidatus Omnitrophica bacterium]|nr:adenylosuccinate lyase [Candidatus Omnitrophota bacterium]